MKTPRIRLSIGYVHRKTSFVRNIMTILRKMCVSGISRGAIITLLLTVGAQSFLFDGPVVSCPNPAEHCSQDMFNRVFANQGCLGCQMGCQPGYTMTANPRYYRDTDSPSAHYTYSGIPIANNVNVSQPQWICLKGDECRGGFFLSKQGDTDACSWCGSGCASCTSYNNCERCLSGFSINPHTLPGDISVVTCTHSDVACPSSPEHCLHDTYVSPGIGCAGCQSCEDGYVVTFNPNYMNLTATNSGTFDYMGMQIRGGVDINEPRYQCVPGDTCQEGWYGTTLGGILFCAECSTGCQRCSSRQQCSACSDGFNLLQGSTATTTTCSPSSS